MDARQHTRIHLESYPLHKKQKTEPREGTDLEIHTFLDRALYVKRYSHIGDVKRVQMIASRYANPIV